MASPASIAKHPIHPMLIVFPVGLWIFSFVSDLVFLFGGATAWSTVALYTMGGGIIGALLAAVPGFIDFLSLTGIPKKVATVHMILNLILVVLFIINFFVRMGGTPILSGPFYLSIVGIVLLTISGWLGGKLVYVLGAAVECSEEDQVFNMKKAA